ncbi:hypothetical protein J7K42_02215 [bacterium]|nr:hypothetical protein [bacterium]
MKAFWEIINWLLAFTYTDFAIISWIEAGKEGMYTFLVMVIISDGLVILNYLLFSGIFKGIDMIRKRLKLSQLAKKWGEKISQLRGNLFFYLFLATLNLIPYIPYVTPATIVAVKLARVPWYYGLTLILAGNTGKIGLMVIVFAKCL